MKFFLILALILTAGCASFSERKEKSALHLQLGISYFDSANYPMALTEFLKAEELDSDNPSVQNNLGLTYFMREKYELSEKHFRRALWIAPRFTDARNNLARLLIERENFVEAETELKKVLNDLTYTGIEKAYINLGLSQFNRKKFDLAKNSFLKAIEQQQDSCVANNYYGRSLFEVEDYKRAIVALNRAISFCQKSSFDEPHYYSALALYRMGDKEKSILRFQEVVKLYPQGRYPDRSRAMIDLIRKVQ
ncbi:MAG: tetratricopeptide repeat protein [Bdellovibrionota bacterium]